MADNDDGSFFKQNFPRLDQYLTHAKKDISHNMLFYNYGVNGAVNVEYNPATKSFNYSSKNQGLASSSTSSDHENERFIKVNGTVQPLVAGTGSCRFVEVEKVEDLCRTASTRGLLPSKLDAAGMINNFSRDHPDIHHGNYLDLVANYFVMYKTVLKKNRIRQKKMEEVIFKPNSKMQQEIGWRLPEKYFTNKGRFKKQQFHKFDASILDIPNRLLHQHITEELKTRLETAYSDCTYYGGTMKTYINEIDDDGFLIYPSGEEMNEINIRILSNPTRNKWNHFDDDCTTPTLGKRVCRFQLDSEVRQSEVSKSKSGKISIATRGDYSIDMFALNENFKFPSPKSVKHVGRMKFEKLISSIALSPYMEDECLSITCDNCVRLWDVSRGFHPSSITIFPNPIAKGDNCAVLPNKNSKVDFGAHPRQILISTNTSLSALDIRGKSSRKREIFACGENDEVISTFLPGHKIENSTSMMNNYQALISTDTYLYLVDERYCKFPLLKWATNLSMQPCLNLLTLLTTEDLINALEIFGKRWNIWRGCWIFISHPCQHMSAISCRRRVAGTREDMDILVFQANQQPQEVRCCHYGWNQQINIGESKISRNTPPYKLTPPQSLESYRELLRDHQGALEVRDRCTLQERFQKKITGIASYPLKDNSFNFLQINSVGDIACQNLRFVAKETAYTCRDVVSHGNTRQPAQEMNPIIKKCIENSNKTSKVQIEPVHHRLKSSDVIDTIRSSMTSRGCGGCRPLSGARETEAESPSEMVCSSRELGRVSDDLKLVDEGRISSDLGNLLSTTWDVGYEKYWIKSQEVVQERCREAEKSLFDLKRPLDGDVSEESEGGGEKNGSLLMLSQSRIKFDTTTRTLDSDKSAKKLPAKTPSSARKKKKKKLGF